MSDFAADYKRLVGPVLHRLARVEGFRVAWGDSSYPGAVSAVTAEAWRLGAGYLDESVAEDLREQIGEWVMEAIDMAWSQIPPDELEAIRDRLDSLEAYFRAWEEAQGR